MWHAIYAVKIIIRHIQWVLILNTNVVNIGIEEVSALGAAYLAGLKEGIFTDIKQLMNLNVHRKQFSSGTDAEKVHTSYRGWKKALQQVI